MINNINENARVSTSTPPPFLHRTLDNYVACDRLRREKVGVYVCFNTRKTLDGIDYGPVLLVFSVFLEGNITMSEENEVKSVTPGMVSVRFAGDDALKAQAVEIYRNALCDLIDAAAVRIVEEVKQGRDPAWCVQYVAKMIRGVVSTALGE